MRYVQLRAFHHVAICGGFSRAAEALSLSQPAVPDPVRKLEEEYDVLLFNREKRRVVLTSAGQRLLTVTQRLFEAERQAAELLAETRTLRSGRLRVIADSAHHLLHVLGSSGNCTRASRSSSPRAIPRRSQQPCAPTRPSSAFSARSRGRASSRPRR